MVMQGCAGGDWAVRVRAEAVNTSLVEHRQRLSLLFYIADSQVSLTVLAGQEHACYFAVSFQA
jgi:hypothetical protein